MPGGSVQNITIVKFDINLAQLWMVMHAHHFNASS